MRKQVGKVMEKKVEALDEAVSRTNAVTEDVRKERADFIKFNEGSGQVHGFKNKVIVAKNNVLFEKEGVDRDILLPVDTLTFLSLEYDMKEIKNSLMKKHNVIQDLRFEENEIYARVDIVKAGEMPVPLLNEAMRTLDEYLAIENVPSELRYLLGTKKDPIKMKDGMSYILLSSELVIANTILKDLPYVESLDLSGTKSEQREAKKEAMTELTKRFMNVTTITESKIQKGKIYFGLVFNCDEIGLVIEINTKHVVVCNLSMSHERFSILAENNLDSIRKGTKVRFVRTSDIVNSKTRELLYARNDMGMMRNPIIELVELTDSDVERILTADINAKPLFMYKEDTIPSYMSLFGVAESKEIDPSTVKKLFSNLYTGEPVFFKDPSKKNKDYLCPNIKQLALFALTGSTDLPIKVGVVSSAKDIAIALQTSK